MKTQVSIAVIALIASSVKAGVNPPTLHWNEDPTTVPRPLSGKPYLTSTLLRYKQQGKSQLNTEVFDINPDFFVPYNRFAIEPSFIQQAEQSSDSDSSSDSSDDDEQGQKLVQWSVAPDLGELDHTVVGREKDIKNGKKFSGWTNPLSWTDDGHDDDTVVVQIKDGNIIQTRVPAERNFLQYAESEGPTKVDLGDSDYAVVYREKDIANGKKFSGWTNPLGWTDDGTDDETVLIQIQNGQLIERRISDESLLQYAESEGPTKVDLGDNDYVVVYREKDIANGKKFSGWTNPLGWTDDGTDDEVVLPQTKSQINF